MGAGNHGGFGATLGSTERNRIGRPVPPTERDYVMALNPEYYASVISNKYKIHLKGSGKKIEIVFNPGLKSAGKVRASNPYKIELGPAAFYSEIELANTIAHELNHSRDFIRGGDAPEHKAYTSGNALEDYIRGRR